MLVGPLWIAQRLELSPGYEMGGNVRGTSVAVSAKKYDALLSALVLYSRVRL